MIENLESGELKCQDYVEVRVERLSKLSPSVRQRIRRLTCVGKNTYQIRYGTSRLRKLSMGEEITMETEEPRRRVWNQSEAVE